MLSCEVGENFGSKPRIESVCSCEELLPPPAPAPPSLYTNAWRVCNFCVLSYFTCGRRRALSRFCVAAVAAAAAAAAAAVDSTSRDAVRFAVEAEACVMFSVTNLA